jgi:hypothetical protein
MRIGPTKGVVVMGQPQDDPYEEAGLVNRDDDEQELPFVDGEEEDEEHEDSNESPFAEQRPGATNRISEAIDERVSREEPER